MRLRPLKGRQHKYIVGRHVEFLRKQHDTERKRQVHFGHELLRYKTGRTHAEGEMEQHQHESRAQKHGQSQTRSEIHGRLSR